MAKHFALIRRSDFTDLFKYGTIFLNHMTIVAADDGSRTTTNDDWLLNELFKNANLFESSFTYLIIEFDQTGFTLDYPALDIESVLNVYPLDDEAKRELEISFDERIRLSAPKWAKTYSLIQKIQTKKECEKGARNVFRIFQLGEKEWQAASTLISNEILNEVVSELYQDERPRGELPIWVYLLRYERHAFYPQETIGFFMDAVHVVCNYLKQTEVDESEVERTSIMRILEWNKTNQKAMAIYESLKKDPDSKPFIDKVNQIEPNVDFLMIAVFFLKLKQRYQEGMYYEPEMVMPFLQNETTKGSCAIALYLLGIVLGHDKTFEALYERFPLKIFRTQAEMAEIEQQREAARRQAAIEMGLRENAEKKDTTRDHKTPNQDPAPTSNSDGRIAFPSDNETIAIPVLPCIMGKIKKNKGFYKKPKPISVTTEEEYVKFFKEGWRVMNGN